MHAPYRPPRPAFGFLLLLGLMTAVGAFSIDMYLPALPTMGRTFGAGPAATQQTIASFVLGMAVGQLVYGQLSDRIGRRGPLLFGMALFAAASAACALAPSIGLLIGARFVQGLGGSASAVISRAIVRDRYDQRDTARVYSWLTLVFGVSPVLAPLFGSLMLKLADWTAIFWALCAIGVALGGAVLLTLPETRSAESRLRVTGSPFRTYWRLLGRRSLLRYLLSAALGQSAIFAYISASSTLFIADFGLTPFQYSLSFAANAIAMVTGAQINRRLLRHGAPDRIAGRALLVGLTIAGLFAALALADRVTLEVALGATFLMMAAHGFTQGNLSASAISQDPDHAGSISALNGTLNFTCGATIAAIVAALHSGSALPLAGTIFACYFGAMLVFRLLRPAR